MAGYHGFSGIVHTQERKGTVPLSQQLAIANVLRLAPESTPERNRKTRKTLCVCVCLKRILPSSSPLHFRSPTAGQGTLA